MSAKTKKERTADITPELNKRLSRLEELVARGLSFQESTDSRILSIEQRLRELASPRRSPNRSFQRLAGLTDITPAMAATEESVRNLTEHGTAWVSLEEVAKLTGRSLSTESAYLKLLSRVGAIDRKAVYEGTGFNRRVRKFVYRPNK